MFLFYYYSYCSYCPRVFPNKRVRTIRLVWVIIIALAFPHAIRTARLRRMARRVAAGCPVLQRLYYSLCFFFHSSRWRNRARALPRDSFHEDVRLDSSVGFFLFSFFIVPQYPPGVQCVKTCAPVGVKCVRVVSRRRNRLRSRTRCRFLARRLWIL